MTFHVRHQDYYGRLGVAENATPEEIRQAFRRRAKQFHPDLNPSPEAKESFLAIHEAYEVLRDEARRAAYDDPFDEDFFADLNSVDDDEDDPEEFPDEDDLLEEDDETLDGAPAGLADMPIDESPPQPPPATRARPHFPVRLATLGLVGVIGLAASVGFAKIATRGPMPSTDGGRPVLMAEVAATAPAAAAKAESLPTTFAPAVPAVAVAPAVPPPAPAGGASDGPAPRDIWPIPQKAAASAPVAPAFVETASVEIAPETTRVAKSPSAEPLATASVTPAPTSASAAAPAKRTAAAPLVRAPTARVASVRAYGRPYVATPIYRRSYVAAAQAAYRARAYAWQAARSRYLARQAYRARLIQMQRRRHVFGMM